MTSRWLAASIEELKETWRFRFVVYAFSSTMLKQRYRRSVLGFGWSLLGPIMNYGVIGVVFSIHARPNIDNYVLYLFSGAVIFSLLQSGFIHAPTIMLNNESYIKKIYLPKLAFVLIAVIVEFVNFLFGIVAILILGMIAGKLEPSWSYLLIPLFALLSIPFLIGVSIMISVMTVFFRDLVHVIPVLMQVAFFMTPVLYETSMLPERYRFIVDWNPFYYFVLGFRYALYYRQWAPAYVFVDTFVLSALAFIVGLWVLKKYDNRIVFKL